MPARERRTMDSTKLHTTYDILHTDLTDPIAHMVKAKAILAPMAGVADEPFRLMCRRFGCKFAFTEMLDVNGIVYNNKKTFRMLETVPEDKPLGIQLVGQDIVKILYVAKICEEKGFKILDLNAGCPAQKVVKGEKGSALLKAPRKLGKIIGRLVKELNIPVTVKIRSGWDDESLNYMEIAKIVSSEGAKALCIHPRTKAQMYKGKVFHDATRQIKENVDIPVFASGNIFTLSDFKDVLEKTGCDGVYIARGALGKPWIFKQINDYLKGVKGEYVPEFNEIKKLIVEHYSMTLDVYGEYIANKRMYKHLSWYFKKLKDLNTVMTAYREVKNPDEFLKFMKRLEIDGNRLILT